MNESIYLKIKKYIYYFIYLYLFVYLILCYNNVINEKLAYAFIFLIICYILLYLIETIYDIYKSKERKKIITTKIYNLLRFCLVSYIIIKNLEFLYDKGYPIFGVKKLINPFFNSNEYSEILFSIYRNIIISLSFVLNSILFPFGLISKINNKEGLYKYIEELSKIGLDKIEFNNYYQNKDTNTYNNNVGIILVYSIIMNILKWPLNGYNDISISIIVIMIVYILINNFSNYNYSIPYFRSLNSINNYQSFGGILSDSSINNNI